MVFTGIFLSYFLYFKVRSNKSFIEQYISTNTKRSFYDELWLAIKKYHKKLGKRYLSVIYYTLKIYNILGVALVAVTILMQFYIWYVR